MILRRLLLVLLLSLHLAPLPAGETSPKERPPFRVALTGKYPPFSYTGADGAVTGFDVAVARAIAERLGRPCEIITTEWDGILAGLLAEKYDAIIGSMAITAEREKQVRFSRPYYVSGAQLFLTPEAAAGHPDIEHCQGLAIGVNLGETYERFLRDRHPEVRVVPYKGMTDIFQDVANGRLAGFVTDRLVGRWQVHSAGGTTRPVGPLLYEERIGIPVRPEETALLAEINSALLALKGDGTLDRLHQETFGTQDSPAHPTKALPNGVIARKLLLGFATTLGIAFAAILLGFLLAIPLGALLHRRRGVATAIARLGVDFLRGTPVLIQLFFVYYGAPQIGITLSPVVAAILTLALNATAYMAETVRAGLLSVDPGQVLAARALGLERLQIFRYVVWPQAFRIALPPLMNSVVALTKDTALVSVITVGEVVREAQSIISITFDPIRYYLIIALLFFLVTYPLMRCAARLEERLRAKGFHHD